MIGVACLIATCLVTAAGQCSRAPDDTALEVRQLTFADVADLRATRIDTVEKQACRLIAETRAIPSNVRIIWIEVERPRKSEARAK